MSHHAGPLAELAQQTSSTSAPWTVTNSWLSHAVIAAELTRSQLGKEHGHSEAVGNAVSAARSTRRPYSDPTVTLGAECAASVS